MGGRPENTRTDARLHLLRLFQLFDSQFPVGAFAHSGGLETYGQAGAGLPELRELLRVADCGGLGTRRAGGRVAGMGRRRDGQMRIARWHISARLSAPTRSFPPCGTPVFASADGLCCCSSVCILPSFGSVTIEWPHQAIVIRRRLAGSWTCHTASCWWPTRTA